MFKDYLTLVNKLYPTNEADTLVVNYQRFWQNQNLWDSRLKVKEIIIRHGQEPVAHLLAQYDALKKVLYFGFIEFKNDESVVHELITKARRLINQAGWVGQVYAPVNGSIWHQYRFQVVGNREPLFDLPQQSFYPTMLKEYFLESAMFHSYSLPTTERYLISQQHDCQIDNYHHDSKNQQRLLYDLTLTIFDDIRHHSQPTFEEFKDQFSYLSQIPDDYLLLAYSDSQRQQVVGMAFGLVIKHQLLIKTVGTIPKFRERGIAKTLFNRLIQQAQREEIKEAKLLYLADNRLVSRLLPAGCQTAAGYVLFNTLK